jgi:hypothetical protein
VWSSCRLVLFSFSLGRMLLCSRRSTLTTAVTCMIGVREAKKASGCISTLQPGQRACSMSSSATMVPLCNLLVLGFMCSALPHSSPNKEHSQVGIVEEVWLETTPYFIGGLSFVSGAFLMAAEAAHSWLSALLPPPPGHLRNVGRWVQFLNVAGSFLFFVGGAFGYYTVSERVT